MILGTPNGLVYITLIISILLLVIMFIVSSNILSKVQIPFLKLFRLIGGKSYDIERELIRAKNLNQKGLIAKYYKWANNVLVNQGLLVKGVTVTGFSLNLVLLGVAGASIITFAYDLNPGLSLFSFILILYILFIINTLRSALYLEKREALIWDTLDLIVPLMDKGAKNAITTLRGTITPVLRPEFERFLMNLRDKMSFPTAMTLLSNSLGYSFEDFASKAILYQSNAEFGMIEIFSDIIESNQNKRILRQESNDLFAYLRTQLVASLAIIFIFTYWFTGADAFMTHFLLYTSFGKFLVLGNIAFVIYIFGSFIMIKAQEFK